jgi:mitotic-spindle organizing protein 1
MSQVNHPQLILDSRGQEIEALFQISQILDTGLDRRALAILLDLIENGVHPEALADVLNEIRSMSAPNPSERGSEERK